MSKELCLSCDVCRMPTNANRRLLDDLEHDRRQSVAFHDRSPQEGKDGGKKVTDLLISHHPMHQKAEGTGAPVEPTPVKFCETVDDQGRPTMKVVGAARPEAPDLETAHGLIEEAMAQRMTESTVVNSVCVAGSMPAWSSLP